MNLVAVKGRKRGLALYLLSVVVQAAICLRKGGKVGGEAGVGVMGDE